MDGKLDTSGSLPLRKGKRIMKGDSSKDMGGSRPSCEMRASLGLRGTRERERERDRLADVVNSYDPMTITKYLLQSSENLSRDRLADLVNSYDPL